MKHGLKILLFVLLYAFSLNITAADEPSILIRQMGAKSVALIMTANTDQAVEVSIMDNTGILLHKGVLKNKTEISQVYNLDNLPEGDYTLIIDEEFRTYIQPIVINENEVYVNNQLLTTLYAPAIRHNDQFLDIDIYCDELSKIDYTLISKGSVIYSDDSKGYSVVQKRFNLNQLEPGKYYFEMNVEVSGIARTFHKSFTI